MMGVFTLANSVTHDGRVEPVTMVNRRAVWRAVDGKDRFVFLASDDRWYVYSTARMRTGAPGGWVCSVAAEPDALTPDQVKGGWQVLDAKKAWVAAPNVNVQTAAAASEKVEQAAAAAARVVFEGQQPGKPQADKLGVFTFVSGRAAGVWTSWAGCWRGSAYRYAYQGSDGRWWIGRRSDERHMRDAWVKSAAAEPDALTPDQVKGGWQVLDAKKAWVAAPSVRACQLPPRQGLLRRKGMSFPCNWTVRLFKLKGTELQRYDPKTGQHKGTIQLGRSVSCEYVNLTQFTVGAELLDAHELHSELHPGSRSQWVADIRRRCNA